MGAKYDNLNIADVSLYGTKVLINNKLYKITPTLISSLAALLEIQTDTIIELAGALLQNKKSMDVIFYSVDGRGISIFKSDVAFISPDDSLTLKNRLSIEGWQIPYSEVNELESKFIITDNKSIGDALRLGMFAVVPHTGIGDVTLNTAVERIESNTFVIMSDKESLLKIELTKPNPLTQVYNGLKLAIVNNHKVLDGWMQNRWAELASSPASMEECLKLIERTNGEAKKAIDIDVVLTGHNVVAPSDVWQMFRKQANTPYTRLDLVNIMSEYASMQHAQRFELMMEAGKIVRAKGDLEFRPAWLSWKWFKPKKKRFYLK